MKSFPFCTVRPLGVVCLLFVLAGCGGGGSDRPELGTVTGTITLDGQPLADADITFQPASARASVGKTNHEGKYELIYLNDIRGAVLGVNQVMITTRKSSGIDGDTSGDVPEKLPAKYHSATTLSADVQPGKNVFDFELQSK